MANRVITGDEAREGVMRGLRLQAEAVKSTLGPKGRNVMFVRPFGLAVTRDGVSVAKEIELEDPLEGAGARLLRMVASSADDDAGDGTTTAVVLAEAMLNEGMRMVAAGCDRLQLERGLRTAVAWALGELKRVALPATPELIKHAATVSLHGDARLGALVAEAIDKVGAEGMITFEDAAGGETTLEHQTGFQWEQGYANQGFVNDQATMSCVLDSPHILLSDRILIQADHRVPNNPLNLYNLLNLVAGPNGDGRPLLIIAERVEGQALTVLAANIQNGVLPSCAVEPPGFGPRRKDTLRDLATAAGAQVFSSEMGHDLSKWGLDKLGSCRRAVVGPTKTMLIEPSGKPKAVAERAEQLRALRGATDDEYEKEQLSQRLGRLTDGAVVIHIGAPTQAEARERKDRLQDAVFSARAAAQEGIVPGGGVALLEVGRSVEATLRQVEGMTDGERLGAKLLLSALEAPARQIATNAGASPDVVLNEIRETPEGWGFNAETGEYEDLVDAGVVDPVRVTRVALDKAASIAGLLLTTEAVVCHIPHAQATQTTIQTPGR